MSSASTRPKDIRTSFLNQLLSTENLTMEPPILSWFLDSFLVLRDHCLVPRSRTCGVRRRGLRLCLRSSHSRLLCLRVVGLPTLSFVRRLRTKLVKSEVTLE